MPISSASSPMKTVRISLQGDGDDDGDSDQGFTAEKYPRRRRSFVVATGSLIPPTIFPAIVNGSGPDMSVGSKHSAYPALPVNGNRMDSRLSHNHSCSGSLSISDWARLSSATPGVGIFTGYYSREHDGCPETRHLALSDGRYPGDDGVILDQSTAADIMKDLGYLPKSDHGYGYGEIQSAIERFQLNHGLEDTGVLDFQTAKAITERRCSSPDTVDIVNLTRLHSPSSDGAPSFTLFPGAPKWDKFDLSFSFESNVPAPAKPPFRRSFAEWARRIRFTSSSPIKAVRIRLRDYDADAGSDSDSQTQSRIKRYHHAIVNEPEPAALSSFTSSSERSGNGAAAAPSQTLRLGLSIGRYPREYDVQRRACGLRTGRAAVVRRWHKFELSYKFDDCYHEEAKPAVRRAFQTWSEASIFSFREISGPGTADITIAMCRGDHGDGYPFNAGPGGVLAHAFYPTDGRLHFNVDQPWNYSLDPPRRGLYDLQSVATHEIGHILGLRHIRNRKAVMYKKIKPNEIRRCLTAKDIRKLKSLYSTDPNFA